jgi:hypothetical protein
VIIPVCHESANAMHMASQVNLYAHGSLTPQAVLTKTRFFQRH